MDVKALLLALGASTALLPCLPLLPGAAMPGCELAAAVIGGGEALGLPAARPTTGTIKGTLDSPFARRYRAVVFIASPHGADMPPPAVNPVMDQRSLRFEPHVLPALAGSTIDFPNSDEVRHSVYTTDSSSCRFNLGTYPAGEVKRVKCDSPGVIVLLCNVHAEMSGYIVVTPTPYFAVTDERGEYEIPDVPAGQHTLTFWHERLAPQEREVVVTAGATTTLDFTNLTRK